ncbi:MAG: methyltransferase domain-containing protein [Acidobacteriota bacterium]
MFEVGADVDVEALMGRIRESAKQRGTATRVPSSTKEERTFAAFHPQRLTQEIRSGALSAEVINQIPLKKRGIKGRIEFRVKKFLKWLVHWNTRGQAEFNHSVTRSLEWIAQDLQIAQGNLTIVDDLLQDERGRRAQAHREANQQNDRISLKLEETGRKSNLLEVRLSEVEQQTSQGLAGIRSRIEKESGLAEQKLRDLEARSAQSKGKLVRRIEEESSLVEKKLRDLEDRSAQSTEELASRIEKESGLADEKLRALEDRSAQSTQELVAQITPLSAIVDELSKRTEVIADHSFEWEREVARMLEEFRQNAQSDVASAVDGLQEQLNRNSLETRRQAEQMSGFLARLQDMAEKSDASLEEIGRRNVALAARSSELEGRLEHALDELRMRILRAERIARNPNRDIDSAKHVKSGEYPTDAQPIIRTQKTNGKQKAGTEALTVTEELSQEFDYFLFEHRYRGSVAEIKRRQSTYLELFRGKENVVDLGCGRGEFLELLSENGINVTGVDINEDMVDFCRDRGLRVVRSDMFEYLTSSPGDKFDAIFLSQVVEHLPPEQILKLVSLCAKKLESGGVIVVETVNTNCPVALGNFYLDPTHVRPVPADMLRFMFEQASFQVKYLRFSSPLPDNNVSQVLDLPWGLSQEVVVYQDYAIVAVRP